ncbi:MAG: tetratricopeptide repeat protein [Armatimonadota bacterium]
MPDSLSRRLKQAIAQADRAPVWLSLTAARQRLHRLPLQPTKLIGREQEVAAVRQRLRSDTVRLLTLTGPPGVGKTRLAIEVAGGLAEAFEQGIAFIDLTPISDPSLVSAAVAQALGIQPEAEQTLDDAIKDLLAAKSMLLVLDNFEQILPAAPRVAELLAVSLGLKILVTSRERLHLRWEHEFPVPPLAVPDLGGPLTPEAVSDCAAVALFVERASAARPDFVVDRQNARAVAEICAGLDGLPLAIELAAARTKVLTPLAMVVWLQHRLRLLAGGPRDLAPRHRTLRAAIDWSYHLLDVRDQALFRRVSVFAGGVSVEAAEAVCNVGGDLGTGVLDGLASLVDKNLLRSEESGGESRFRMLATVHEFAAEALEASGERDALVSRHTAYFMDFAEKAIPALYTADQIPWLRRLDREQDNLRAALNTLASREEWEAVLRFATALRGFWHLRGRFSEGRRWLDEALEKACDAPPVLRARALWAAGTLARGQGDFVTANALLADSLALSEQSQNKQLMAHAKIHLASLAARWGDLAGMRALAEESLALFQAVGDGNGIARSLVSLGSATAALGDQASGRVMLTQALTMMRELGDRLGMASVLYEFGVSTPDSTEAREFLEEAHAVYTELGDPVNIAWGWIALGGVATREENWAEAQACFERALTIAQELGSRYQMSRALGGLGRVAFFRGDYKTARAYQEECLALLRQIGTWSFLDDALADLGSTLLHLKDYTGAATLLEEAVSLCRRLALNTSLARVLSDLGLAAHWSGDLGRAADLYKESLTLRRERNDLWGIADSLVLLASVDDSREDVRRPARLLGAAEAAREPWGTAGTATRRQNTERLASALRTRLGPRAFAAAWAEGRRLPLDQIIEQAMAIQPGQPAGLAGRPARAGGPLAPLSPREQEVAELVARGLSNREIAAVLMITEGTAQNHIQHMLNKLGFNTRTQIAAWVVAHHSSSLSAN